jgi:hypothetical protein
MAVNANPHVVAQTGNVIEETANIDINGSDNAIDTAALPMLPQTTDVDNFVTPNEPLPTEMDIEEASMAVSSGVTGVNPPDGAQIYNHALDMSEDSYPHNDQFEPEDAANGTFCFDFGLEFEDGGDVGYYGAHCDANLDFDWLLNYSGLTTD